MIKSSRLRGWVVGTALIFGAGPAMAFQILSPVTTACHEKIVLGTIGDPTGFSITGQADVSGLLSRMKTLIGNLRVPDDRASQAMIHEMTVRYQWQDRPIEEQFMLASLVAGVRAPDTSGFSIVDLNELRSIHIRDNDQSAHSLRTSQEDYDAGNPQALVDVKARLNAQIQAMSADWNAVNNMLRKQQWPFAFYGEQDVMVFAPAYDLGLMAHTIEDSYAHTLRDDSFNIISVLNYVDAVNGQLNEKMDGPPHSQRLDECNFDGNVFDNMRIKEAGRQTALMFNLMDNLFSSGGSDFTATQAQIEQIYAYRDGCDLDNKYCDSTWYPISESSITKPFLGGCGTILARDFSDGPPTLPPGNLALLALLFTTPFLTALLLKWRFRRDDGPFHLGRVLPS